MKTSRIKIKSLYGVTEQVILGSSVEITGSLTILAAISFMRSAELRACSSLHVQQTILS